ncbi:hypothetical protein [Agrococcus sp. ProA11]|uniref:hypothetical protein n=1 Tax=Agrococcus chionoecetis TaxID=3153752 RepID=UPI00325FE65E
MSEADDSDSERAFAVLEQYVQRAERIGRLAAIEHTPHEEAHRIAAATAVLASTDFGREAARARLRRAPLIHLVLALVILLQLTAVLNPEGQGFTLFSLITILYVAVHAAELTVGNPLHRAAARLPGPVQRLISPHFFVFEHAVLSAYSEECRSIGHPGCECVTSTEGA